MPEVVSKRKKKKVRRLVRSRTNRGRTSVREGPPNGRNFKQDTIAAEVISSHGDEEARRVTTGGMDYFRTLASASDR